MENCIFCKIVLGDIPCRKTNKTLDKNAHNKAQTPCGLGFFYCRDK